MEAPNKFARAKAFCKPAQHGVNHLFGVMAGLARPSTSPPPYPPPLAGGAREGAGAPWPALASSGRSARGEGEQQPSPHGGEGERGGYGGLGAAGEWPRA